MRLNLNSEIPPRSNSPPSDVRWSLPSLCIVSLFLLCELLPNVRMPHASRRFQNSESERIKRNSDLRIRFLLPLRH